MKIFNYSNEGGAYLGESEARVDPLEYANDVDAAAGAHAKANAGKKDAPAFDPESVIPTKFILPAYATDQAPPPSKDGFTRCFRSGVWMQVKDEPPPPEVEPEITWAGIRSQRNWLLSESDWTQMADAPLTDQQRADWRAYRKALRDLPSSGKNPAAVTFPAAPKEA